MRRSSCSAGGGIAREEEGAWPGIEQNFVLELRLPDNDLASPPTRRIADGQMPSDNVEQVFAQTDLRGKFQCVEASLSHHTALAFQKCSSTCSAIASEMLELSKRGAWVSAQARRKSMFTSGQCILGLSLGVL